MIDYVLGFAFSTDSYAQTYVALIEKLKPDWQRGKCNGIGGKVEDTDGHYYDAMVREFAEETGVETDRKDWLRFATMTFGDARVLCYASRMDWEKFNGLWSPTDEQVIKVRADRVWNFKPLPNLAWLVPMAQAFLNDKDLTPLEISE